MSEDREDWRKKITSFPELPGVYLFSDHEGKIMYIGKAASLKERLKAYLAPPSSASLKEQIIQERAKDVSFIVTGNVPEALITESTLVKMYQPFLNVKLKDDKRFPYLKISTSELFPKMAIVRSRRDSSDRYFGPFTEAKALRRTVRMIKELFKIPSCKVKIEEGKPLSPCLEYHIKRCSAPCAGNVSPEDYQVQVKEAILFLEGKNETLLGYLRNRMSKEAGQLNFEEAARIRDQIFSIKKVLEAQEVLSPAPVSRDVLAFYGELREACLEVLKIREGKLLGSEHFFLSAISRDQEDILSAFVQYYEKASQIPPQIVIDLDVQMRKALEDWLLRSRGVKSSLLAPRGESKKQMEIAMANAKEHLSSYLKLKALTFSNKDLLELAQKELGLLHHPFKIEGYDISNLGDRETVGAKVLFTNCLPEKKGYRHYLLQGDRQDDYEMIKEVLKRRLNSEEDLPDLFLIDGGIGHLHVAMSVFEEKGVSADLLSIAKEKEEIYSPQFEGPIILSANSPVLQLLQQVRDEAHRFANSYHRKVRARKLTYSQLEEIPGIGQAKKLLLLRSFGSYSALKNASLIEIASLPGLGEKTAKRIYTYLHEKDDEKATV